MLNAQRNPVPNPALLGYHADTEGHPEAEIDNGIRPQFHRGALGNHFSFVKRENAHAEFTIACITTQRRVIVNLVSLLLLRCEDQGIDKDTGDFYRARIEPAPRHRPFDLGDNLSTRIFRRLRNRKHLEIRHLFLHGDVPFSIRRCPAHKGDIHRETGIKEVFLPVQGDNLHQFLCRARVEFAAFQARIYEGM